MELKSKNELNYQMALLALKRLFELCTQSSIQSKSSLSETKEEIKQYLHNNITIIKIICGKFDKYGRLLANIFTYNDEKSISEYLLSEKLAYQYDGGKKLTEDEQIEKLN